ncbi:hypothetical protein JXA47_01775 [Candidatus Sumerlaeota bacterium]|nr:hypothetical protein [Candidatus Sumerlaeota bacterium]
MQMVARLAEISPRDAAGLLARLQSEAFLFPGSMSQRIAQLGALTDPAVAEILQALLLPSSGASTSLSALPEPLASALSDPAQLGRLLKFAAEMADEMRAGGLYPDQTQGGVLVPPGRRTMDGLFNPTLGPRLGTPSTTSSSFPAPSSSSTVASELMSSLQVGVEVDVVSLSQAGRGAVGVDVMVRVNQILGQALGEDNPLALSQTQIEVGVSVLQGLGSSPPPSPLDNVALSFAERLVDLRRSDPEAFNKLISMLKALAKLNPGKFDRFLAQVESQLRGIIAAQQQPAAPTVIDQVVAQVGQGGESAARSITVTVDVQVTQRVDQIIADLRGAGLEAHAVQSESVTQIQVSVTIGQGEVQRGDPLIIDLQGDGVDLTGREAVFDLNGDGQADQSAFVQGDDALLMVDANGDGRLTDGRELFGDQEGDANGFAELSKHDDNGDGVIDARDAIFEKLRVIHDKSGDGVTGMDEMSTLRDVGIRSISLAREAYEREDANGNLLRERSDVTRDDGSVSKVYEADLTYRALG